MSRQRYCRKAETRFLEAIEQQPPTTMQELNRQWYGGRDHSGYHYDDSRYHGLNLHSVFNKGTIEFRRSIPPCTPGKSRRISSYAWPSAIRR